MLKQKRKVTDCRFIKRLPLSLGSNSASNSALVGSCASAAAARAALVDLFTALVLGLLVLLLLLLVVVLVSVFFIVFLTWCPRNAACILIAAFAVKNELERKTKAED
uniref:Uncharacterized protein n=1 Tax=Glossina brevipalpis TaxID=37001 RepID=A0A1A9W7U4_9MUSC